MPGLKPSCLLPLAVFWLVARAALADEAVPEGPRKGVLLLRNGEVIAGTISPAGDRYDVLVGDGEVRIKRADVELIAKDVGECYLHRRRGIETGRVQDHLELADWCLRHGMPAEAANEIGSSRQADPRHPKLQLLERRLALLQDQPDEKPKAALLEETPLVATDQLDQMVRELPARSVESFTSTIQPLLLNRCATAACHGSHSESTFRLIRIPPHRPTSRRTTQRNLFAALSVIDQDSPEASSLLTTPLRAHGGSAEPIFPNRESTQYQQLARWVLQLGGQPEATVEEVIPAAFNQPSDEALPDVPTAASQLNAAQRANRNRIRKPASRIRRELAEIVTSESDEDEFDSEAEGVKPSAAQLANKKGSAEKGVRDRSAIAPPASQREPIADEGPLDPEIFNKRFAGEQ